MREYCGFRSWLDHVREFSRGLIKESLNQGDGNDIMSVLLRANASSSPKNKMHDSELVDQIVFVTSIGGHVVHYLLVSQIQHISCGWQ